MLLQLTAADVYDRHARRLGLQWLAGRPGGASRVITTTDMQRAGSALIGYFNPIHVNHIQVLGADDLAQLALLGKNSQCDALERLFAGRPLAVIVCDQPAPAELVQQAEASATPLWASNRDCDTVIGLLRQNVEGALTEKLVLHGVFMEVLGIGVLITGESGAGKSELALELVNRGHRLIADDAPEFYRYGPDTLRGSCPAMLQDMLEVRGLGILNVRSMYGDNAVKLAKNLHFIINLQLPGPERDQPPLDRVLGSRRTRTLLEVEVPEVSITVAPGRNMAVLVEAATRQHGLLRSGYDAGQEFMRRQQRVMEA